MKHIVHVRWTSYSEIEIEAPTVQEAVRLALDPNFEASDISVLERSPLTDTDDFEVTYVTNEDGTYETWPTA